MPKSKPLIDDKGEVRELTAADLKRFGQLWKCLTGRSVAVEDDLVCFGEVLLQLPLQRLVGQEYRLRKRESSGLVE